MISEALSVLENEKQRNELAEIYNNSIKIFYSIALKLLNRKQDAEDAIQEAFMHIAENPDLLFRVSQEKRIKYKGNN